MITRIASLIAIAIFSTFVFSCATSPDRSNLSAVATQATPRNNITPADIAKLKWIEGTWRGMDGDTPFYERYRIEESAMVVEGLKDGDSSAVESTDRFELVNGEFGKTEGDKRSVASEIGDGFIQFVPAVAGKGNSFRFVRQPDGTWQAILEWPAAGDKPARTKVYKMERWPLNAPANSNK
jgi:hypothetical protein